MTYGQRCDSFHLYHSDLCRGARTRASDVESGCDSTPPCYMYICLDGRCRSCTSDADCIMEHGSPQVQCRGPGDSFPGRLCVVTPEPVKPPPTPSTSSAPQLDEASKKRCAGMTKLPDPAVWRVKPPKLTPQQQKRLREVDRYLVELFCQYKIVTAIQTYSGDIVYWVESASMPGADVQPPPLPWKAEDLKPPEGVKLGIPEILRHPELRGPPGTTPIHRPDFWNYIMGETCATSIRDYVENHQVGSMSGPTKTCNPPSPARPAAPRPSASAR